MKKFIKILLRPVFSLARTLFKLWFRVRAIYPVWYYWLNRKNRFAYRRWYVRSRPQLDEVEKRLIEDLKRDGIARVTLDELFPGRNLFPALKSHADQLAAQAATRTAKKFLRFLWDPEPVLELDNPFVTVALERRMLDIINSYMGLCAKFYYLTLNVTVPVPAGSQAVQSQRWHRDPDDKRMCKVFLYLTDVDAGAGPFTYVKGTQLGGRWRHLFPQEPPAGCYPPAGAVEKAVPPQEMVAGIAPAGTLIFCDTSGLHFGGYATERERIMFTAGYCSSASAWPLRFKYPATFAQVVKAKGLDPVQRFALTYDQSALVKFAFQKIKKGFRYG
jgi:hypothetical protein